MPLAYDDPIAVLTRLKQTSTVVVYKAQFKALSNRLKGLSKRHKLSYFLSGLKDEIRLPIKMFSLVNLGAALGLAKIQEELIISSCWTWRGDSAISDKKPYEYSGDSNQKLIKEVAIGKKILSVQMDEKKEERLPLSL